MSVLEQQGQNATQLANSPASDLSQLSIEELKEKANGSHRQFCGAIRKAITTHARRAGAALAEIKRRLAFGEWEPWVQEHFDGGLSTARVYMQIHNHWEQLEEFIKEDELHALTLRELREALRNLNAKASQVADEMDRGEDACGGDDSDDEEQAAEEPVGSDLGESQEAGEGSDSNSNGSSVQHSTKRRGGPKQPRVRNIGGSQPDTSEERLDFAICIPKGLWPQFSRRLIKIGKALNTPDDSATVVQLVLDWGKGKGGER
jgi:hypothetical protein